MMDKKAFTGMQVVIVLIILLASLMILYLVYKQITAGSFLAFNRTVFGAVPK